MSGPTENGAALGLLHRFVPGDYASIPALQAAAEAGTVPCIPQVDEYGNWTGGLIDGNVNTLEPVAGAVGLFGNDWYMATRLPSSATDVWVREVWALKDDAFDGITIPSGSNTVLAGFFAQLDAVMSDNTNDATRVTTPTRLQMTLHNFANDRVMWRSRPEGQTDANPTMSEATVRTYEGTLLDVRWRAVAHLDGEDLCTTIDVVATVNDSEVVDDIIDRVAQDPTAVQRTGAWGSVTLGGSFMKIGLTRFEVYDASVNATPWAGGDEGGGEEEETPPPSGNQLSEVIPKILVGHP